MNKRINFEDTLFILNARIRMVRDLLNLDIESGFFYSKTTEDMEFINSIMELLAEKFLDNLKFLDREAEADNILDAEWQFNQLLSEFSSNSNLFSSVHFPEKQALVIKLRTESQNRKKKIEESYVPAEQPSNEPVVSHAELNGLLGRM